MINLICFRRTGEREDYPYPGRPTVFSLIKRGELPPVNQMNAMDTVEIEDIPDSHIGSSDGSVAIFAHDGEVMLRRRLISRNTWESEMARGRKWRPVKSIAAILTGALGVPLNAFDHLLPKTQEESYYDGDVWRVLQDLYLPHRQDGVLYDVLWVRPQPPDPETGAMVFLTVVRRRREKVA